MYILQHFWERSSAIAIPKYQECRVARLQVLFFSISATDIEEVQAGTNLTVDDALVNVPNGSLSHVGVCDGESALVRIGYTSHC